MNPPELLKCVFNTHLGFARRDGELFDCQGYGYLGPKAYNYLAGKHFSFWIFYWQIQGCFVVGNVFCTFIKIPVYRDNAEWFYDKMR